MPYPTSLFDGWPSARFLAYNASTGEAHFDEVSDDSFQVAAKARWTKGWSVFAPTFLTGVGDGSEGFLAYDGKSGEVHFDRLL